MHSFIQTKAVHNGISFLRKKREKILHNSHYCRALRVKQFSLNILHVANTYNFIQNEAAHRGIGSWNKSYE